ncbi:hypothetical protein B296_00023380 [Ensete ventricosum]|uniref:Uncharacterized protein n=1 Tax=Ensete ventricosum TaxID=4639 RepID=A0A427A237_ENSVE|nr:hypothetical protein B296_00023380 [Ensete ventricosum]
MADLLDRTPGALLEARWSTLTTESRFWSDGVDVAEHAQGVLSPVLAKQLYEASSEVVIDWVAKSLVWNHQYTMVLIDQVHDRVISCMGDKITNLRSKIRDLKEGFGPATERHVVDLQTEVERLKTKLAKLDRQRGEL